jgi:hypothetical protein
MRELRVAMFGMMLLSSRNQRVGLFVGELEVHARDIGA